MIHQTHGSREKWVAAQPAGLNRSQGGGGGCTQARRFGCTIFKLLYDYNCAFVARQKDLGAAARRFPHLQDKAARTRAKPFLRDFNNLTCSLTNQPASPSPYPRALPRLRSPPHRQTRAMPGPVLDEAAVKTDGKAAAATGAASAKADGTGAPADDHAALQERLAGYCIGALTSNLIALGEK